MTSPKDILEGKPVRSPLHPAVVHFPLALFPLSLLLDLASWIWPQPHGHLVSGALFAIGAGLVTALVAAVLGFVDYSEIRDDHPAKKPATLHMLLNLVAVGLFGLGFGLRLASREAAATPLLPLALSVVALGLLAYSGYVGGHLVYSDGVAVGRHRRPQRLPRGTLALSGTSGEMVRVADVSQTEDGDIIRVMANGVAVVLARAADRWYGVQEYCTHRYAPLSEGQVHDCQVTCPWHRSRFDLRTGEVTEGPAAVPLRTFTVEVRDGQLWLQLPSPPAA